MNALVSERQGRERLSATLSQLRDYSLRIEDQAALQERNRIAREIHDALGHTLTAQSVQLDSGLHLSVKNHVTSILSRLNLSGRIQAAMFASPFLPLLHSKNNKT